jgi:hypothetical protein
MFLPIGNLMHNVVFERKLQHRKTVMNMLAYDQKSTNETKKSLSAQPL